MRVLLATDHFPPLIGGAQIQSQMLARELRARGHHVEVGTVWHPGLPAVEEIDGIRIHRFRELRSLPLFRPSRRQHQPPYPDPVTVIALRRLIRSFKPDILDSYGWISYSAAAALLGRDIPLIITVRDYAYSCAIRTLLYEGKPCSGPGLAKCVSCAGTYYGAGKGTLAALGVLANRPLLRSKVRGVRSISSYAEAIIRRDFLGDAERAATRMLSVIPDMIRTGSSRDDGLDANSRARVRELPDEPFILFVGAFRRVKGVHELLAAYGRLHDPPPLVLIGTSERDSPSFPPNVRVLFDFPHDAVMAAWDRCLFGVLPSVLPEPFGTVVTEAMSMGKPVIGTRPGGHTDLITDGETGLLVSAGDVGSLRDAMERLIDDPELRARMGQAARGEVLRFTPQAVIPQIEALYASVLAGQMSLPSEAPGVAGLGEETGWRSGRS